MAYLNPTPVLGLELANPGTAQPFSTAHFNAQMLKIESFAANTLRPSVSDLDALAALGGSAGLIAVVREGGALFQRVGSTWVQQTVARFASVADRDAAYAKAGGVFRTPLSRARIADRGYETVFITDKWVGVGGRSLIRPELAGAGAVLNPDGTAKITNGNKIFFNKVFTTDFDSYVVEINPLYGSVNGQGINFRFAVGGAEKDDNVYYFQGVSQSGNDPEGSFKARPARLFDIARCGNGKGSSTVGVIEVFDPVTADTKSRAMWRTAGSDGTTDHMIDAGGNFGANQSHDGFVLFDAGSATFTGTVKVFGLGLGS